MNPYQSPWPPSGFSPDNRNEQSADLDLGRTYKHQKHRENAGADYVSAPDTVTRTKAGWAKANASGTTIQARQIHSPIGSHLGTAGALHDLGETYLAQSKYQEAEQAFIDSHKIHSSLSSDLGAVNALYGLGETYLAQSKYQEAEQAFVDSHKIHSSLGSDRGAVNALYGLGETYLAQSRYQEAEQAFVDSHKIHSSLSSNRGAPNALYGLGETYLAQSRYKEAEQAFIDSHKIHSNLGSNQVAANALYGLGETYLAQSKYQEAEQAFADSHKVYSSLGSNRGAPNALYGLGETYLAQSRYQEAEQAFIDSHKIHSSRGSNQDAVNALYGLGETYLAQSKYQEAEQAFMNSHKIHSSLGSDMGAANALCNLEETYLAQSRYQEAEQAFMDSHKIHSRLGSDRGAANALYGLGETYLAQSRNQEAEQAFGAAYKIQSRIQSVSSEDSGGSPRNDDGPNQGVEDVALPSLEDIEAASRLFASERTESIKQLEANMSGTPVNQPNVVEYRLQRSELVQDFALIESDATSSTKHIEDLILAIGRAIPKAIRNKHQLYRLTIRCRDICNHLHHVVHEEGDSSTGFDSLERCWDIMDGLERTLLKLTNIVSEEATPFGASSLTTWKDSSTTLGQMYYELTVPPLNISGTNILEYTTWDRYFDDCSWLSLLLLEGIETPIQRLYPEEESTPSEVQSVIEALSYLVEEMKLNGNIGGDERSRKRFTDFWNAAAIALQAIDLEKRLDQETVDLLHRSWSDLVNSHIQPMPTPGTASRPAFQYPILMSLPEEIAHIGHEITPATEPLTSLLQALGREAPKATRNKHKIYAIIVRARDICNYILAIGTNPEFNGLDDLNEYYKLMDATEGAL